ncbi:MAG: hypothetical protein E6R03_07395 [Hyphomicrobiaceae bacterium]|nr:MAG: hypothetical protein E6R03_07395 [Hyphomicrobiaceae bacterium]
MPALVFAPMPINGDPTQASPDVETISALPFTPNNYVIRAIRCNTAMTLTYDSWFTASRTAKFAAGETRYIMATKITGQSAGVPSDIEVMY